MFLLTRIKVINSNVRFNWAFLFDDPFVKLSSYHIAGCLKKCPPFKYHYEKLFHDRFHAWRIHLKKIVPIELIKFLYANWWKKWSLRYAIQLTQIFFHWNRIKLPHSTFAWSGRNLAKRNMCSANEFLLNGFISNTVFAMMHTKIYEIFPDILLIFYLRQIAKKYRNFVANNGNKFLRVSSFRWSSVVDWHFEVSSFFSHFLREVRFLNSLFMLVFIFRSF